MLQRLFGGGSTVPSVNAPEAWERLKQNDARALLIDVREDWEYSKGHARGARNIPLSQLQQRSAEVPRDRDILLICQSGHRSMQAAKVLQQQGWEMITNVTGGTSVWKMQGLPME
jgi:rhodanese-related sulfurtransferase